MSVSTFTSKPGITPLPCTSPCWKYVVGIIDECCSALKETSSKPSVVESDLIVDVISKISSFVSACSKSRILKTGTDDEFKGILKKLTVEKVDLTRFKGFIDECLPKEKRGAFVSFLLSLVKDLPKEFPDGNLETLNQGCNGTVVLSRRQVAVLLTNAVFGTYAIVGIKFSFSLILAKQRPKTFGILHYLERFFDAETKGSPLKGNISVIRIVGRETPSTIFEGSEKKLCNVVFEIDRGIEAMQGMIQTDFANKYIGGGVLRNGNTQEEIRFGVFSPECLVSLLVAGEPMLDNEAIIITGCEKFSMCRGYFRWITDFRDFKDTTPTVDDGSLDVTIVAIDAMNVREDPRVQFERDNITREIYKAYLGFSADPRVSSKPVATGKWGCGVFHNDVELKFVQQWIACSAVDSGPSPRVMHFHTFHKKETAKELRQLMDKIRGQGIDTVGRLYEYALHFTPSSPVPPPKKRGRKSKDN